MMFGTKITPVEIYHEVFKTIDHSFNMNVSFTKVHKQELQQIDN